VEFQSSVMARSKTRVSIGMGLLAEIEEWRRRRKRAASAQRRSEFNDDGTGSKVQK
jgi:hypothetical protein